MRIILCEFLTLEQKQSLFELWNLEYPERICYNEIGEFENYLKGLSNQKHYLLINKEDTILGWAFTFDRDEDNWFAIILNSKIHRKGYGRFLLEELKKNNLVLNGWVTDHQQDLKRNKEPYFSPIEFYTKNEFLVHPNIRIENDKISAVKIRWEKS
jgi:hypothetical protein